MVQLNMSSQFAKIAEHIQDFFSFIKGKLRDFSSLTLGEQIAYPAVGVGMFCLLVSLVLWIL